jgi:acyl transferase domain-containing protein
VSLSAPRIPYVSNLTGTWITDQEATSPGYYAEHLRRAVRFEDGVRTLAADPSTLLLEVGPGNALASMARLTLGKPERVIPSMAHPRERRPDPEAMLEAAGRLWLAGGQLDWKGARGDEAPRRVPLPTYPFERRRCWVEATPTEAARSASAGPRASADPGEWLYAPTWMRDDAVSARAGLDGVWLVLARAGPLGEAVARCARGAGATVVLVEPGDRLERLEASRYRVRPGNDADLGAVVREVRAAGSPVRGVLHLWLAEDEDGLDPVTSGYHTLVALAAVLEPAPSSPVRILVGTVGGASVLDEPVRRPEVALSLGPVLSLPTEVPGLRMRAVDLRFEGAGAHLQASAELVAEAAAADGEDVVARRAGRRWVRRVERITVAQPGPGDLPLKQRGVYVITGGLGGVGLTLAGWLARQASARLLLTSRTPLPPREEWGTWSSTHPAGDRIAQAIGALQAIEAAGGEVLAEAADVADEGAMRAALARAQARWGRIDGLIHAAGVSGNARVAFRKDDAEVRAVLAPKVDGLAVLIRLLGDQPLDFVALLSSVNSLVGAPGLCDYAAANAALDAFPASTVSPTAWRHVLAINYSAWRDVGMATRVVVPEARRQAWEEHLRAGIPPEAGAAAFARALASGRQQVAVTPFDLVEAMALARRGDREPAPVEPARESAGPAEPSSPAQQAQDRPELSTPYQAPSTAVERRLAEVWAELLGVQRIGVHDDFFELGGHSLLATRVLTRIAEALGARLTMRDVFDAPTIHALATRIDAALGDRGAETPPGEREELEF